MGRKRISPQVVNEVLLRCRRRCCLCFGLNRDTALKNGQIAHLDQNRDNNRVENLAFLSLDHHDEYDSRTSQRKGFTQAEVEAFRDELEQSVFRSFSQEVHFGSLTLPRSDPFAGQWIRLGGTAESAEIVLTPLPDSPDGFAQYHVAGLAMCGTNRKYGPGFGTLEHTAVMEKAGVLELSRARPDRTATTRLIFTPSGDLLVQEENCLGEYGLNVTFMGKYRRAEGTKR